MELIRPDYYDTFRCVGGECPCTCCAYWRIDVDDETDRFYQSCTDDFGEYLNRFVVRSEGRTRMELINGRCAMLSEDGLCRIQLEYGERGLSKTCREFPRGSRLIGGTTLRYLKMSCPEMMRQLLGRKKALKLLQSETNEPMIAANVRGIESQTSELMLRTFRIGFRLLQDRTYTVSQRERLFCLMNKALSETLSMDDYSATKRTLLLFSNEKEYGKLAGKFCAPDVPALIRLFRCFCKLVLSIPQQSMLTEVLSACIRYLGAENADYEMIAERLRDFQKAKLQIERENILLGLLLDRYLGRYAERDPYRQAAYIVTLESFYRILYAVISTQNGKALELSDRILLNVHISRFFEHIVVEEFFKRMDAIFAENGIHEMEFLFRLTG